MSNLMLLGEGSTESILGIGSIDEVLPRMVNGELQHEFGDKARLDPTHIALTALGYRDRSRFQVCSWTPGSEDDLYTDAQPHVVTLELKNDGDPKPLAGKYFTLSSGERINLRPEEALFFLGLDFRALAHNNAMEQPRRQSPDPEQ